MKKALKVGTILVFALIFILLFFYSEISLNFEFESCRSTEDYSEEEMESFEEQSNVFINTISTNNLESLWGQTSDTFRQYTNYVQLKSLSDAIEQNFGVLEEPPQLVDIFQATTISSNKTKVWCQSKQNGKFIDYDIPVLPGKKEFTVYYYKMPYSKKTGFFSFYMANENGKWLIDKFYIKDESFQKSQ